MDEFERELRATFDHLADAASASDDLVERTLDRSVKLRRNRRVLGAATVAGTLAVMAVVASVAGAGTRAHVEVTGPPVVELPSTTTTQPLTSTTVAPSVTTTPARGSSVPPGTAVPPSSIPTTIPAACNPPIIVDDIVTGGQSDNGGQYTLLANGDVKVDYYFIFGPARETHEVVLDDGTRSSGGFTRIYTPAEFGSHWYDEWITIATTVGCRERHNFVVDPATATPDTTPVITTVPVETTIPVTTVPDTTTTTAG